MGMDSNSGQMVPNMKDSGKIIKHMDKVLSGMSMEINMKDNGNVIKLTELENIHT
tara:strand:- start:14 stop:178 length:165 start_codon:yes stop_codon:yes gene_type:complete